MMHGQKNIKLCV